MSPGIHSNPMPAAIQPKNLKARQLVLSAAGRSYLGASSAFVQTPAAMPGITRIGFSTRITPFKRNARIVAGRFTAIPPVTRSIVAGTVSSPDATEGGHRYG